MVQPLFHTESHGLPNEGQAIADLAAKRGVKLMPWQRRMFDVATQHEDGAYLYPLVIVSVPRQSGKTEGLHCLVDHKLHHGALDGSDFEGGLTAQTRADAVMTWQAWLREYLDNDDLASRLEVRRAGGSEGFALGRNRLRVYSPLPTASHGRVLSQYLWDEIWSFDETRGAEILQGVMPTMITKRDRQIWMVSTAGSVDSTFFRGYVDRGRAGDSGMCYIEYGCPPGYDALDLRHWPEWHPALGLTIDRKGIEQAKDIFGDDIPGFLRAYGNVWPEGLSNTGAIDAHVWESAGDTPDDVPPAAGQGACVAVDVDPYGLSASICVAWRDGKTVRVELAEHREGVAWIVPRATEICARLRVRQIVGHDYGPCVPTLDRLERSGLSVQRMTGRQASAATQDFLSGLREGRIRHVRSDLLTQTAAQIQTRPYGDGVQWVRKGSGVTSALTAATWAVAAVESQKMYGVPRIVVAS